LGTERVQRVRHIPLDEQTPTMLRQWSGVARGRWEGETLVVESTHFRPEGTGTIWLTGAYAPDQPTFDEHLHLIERFWRTDADTLMYRFTVDDPTVWTMPWTVEIPMTKGKAIYEYACHEGNYALGHLLSGARATEADDA